MSSIKYILTRKNLAHHLPYAVSGYSGKNYGHMVYRREYAAHAIEIPGSMWDAGAGGDIIRKMFTSKLNSDLQVRAVLVPGADSPEAKASEELEALRIENAALKEQLAARNMAAAEPEVDPVMAEAVKEPEVDTAGNPKREELAALTYRELYKLAKEANAAGADHPLAELTTKAALIAALAP